MAVPLGLAGESRLVRGPTTSWPGSTTWDSLKPLEQPPARPPMWLSSPNAGPSRRVEFVALNSKRYLSAPGGCWLTIEIQRIFSKIHDGGSLARFTTGVVVRRAAQSGFQQEVGGEFPQVSHVRHQFFCTWQIARVGGLTGFARQAERCLVELADEFQPSLNRFVCRSCSL